MGRKTAMGSFIRDTTTLDIICQLNLRFSAGVMIIELAALHNEFQIFGPGHDLRSSYELIGVHPLDQVERRRWHSFLDNLKTYPSDRAGVNGHDRIIAAYVENFQNASPLPVFTQVHAAKDDPRVLITTGHPIVFSQEQHLIKSIPIIPAGQAAAAPVGSGPP
jgi:hypothetical protein